MCSCSLATSVEFSLGVQSPFRMKLVEQNPQESLIRALLVCTVLVPRGSRLFVPTFLLRLTAHDQSVHMDFNLQPTMLNIRWAI